MDKQIKIWIAVLEKASENITGTLNYNGLIIDDLEALIQDMQRAKGETEKGVMPCQKCGEKIIGTWHCKSCARKLYPFDREI